MNEWTFENCKNEALKYSTKIDFKKNSMSAYVISNRNGWMPEISKHMIIVGSKFKRCVYAYEFSDNYVYVGLTFNLDERENNRNSHSNDAVTKHRNETCLIPLRKQLTEYIDRDEARILEGYFVEYYKSNGWNILNTRPTGGIGGNTIIWTKEKCIEAANNCKTRTDFHRLYRGAYSSSIKNGWIDIIYDVLKSRKGGKVIHTIESCSDKALLCKTRAEFKKTYAKEFNAAYNNNWLDKICAHMINGRLKQNKKNM